MKNICATEAFHLGNMQRSFPRPYVYLRWCVCEALWRSMRTIYILPAAFIFFYLFFFLLSTLRRSSSEDIEFPSSGWGARGDANCTLFFLEGWSILKYISAFSTCLDRWSRGSRMYAFVRGTHALLYALVLFLNRYWVKRNTYSLPHLLAVR